MGVFIMNLEQIHDKATELEKVEGIIQLCVNSLYDEKSDKNRVAYILEMVNDKLSLIKEEFDNITQIN
jgi:hypothetical protein